MAFPSDYGPLNKPPVILPADKVDGCVLYKKRMLCRLGNAFRRKRQYKAMGNL